MASASKDRFNASFYRLRYHVPLSTCTDVVVAGAPLPQLPANGAAQAVRAAAASLIHETVDAVAGDGCVYLHIKPQQSMRTHANKVRVALDRVAMSGVAVELVTPEETDKINKSIFEDRKRAAHNAAAQAPTPVAAVPNLSSFTHQQWDAVTRMEAPRMPGPDWTGYIIRIFYTRAKAAPPFPDPLATVPFPDPVPMSGELCAVAATIKATSNTCAIVVDKYSPHFPDHYLYVQTSHKPDRKKLMVYLDDLNTLLRATPEPPGFRRHVPTRRDYEEILTPPLDLMETGCVVVSKDGISTPWPPTIGIRVREHEMQRGRVVDGWLASNNMSVAHPRLLAAYTRAAAVPVAAAIVADDPRPLAHAAMALAPADSAPCALAIARVGDSGGTEALAVRLAALQDVQRLNEQVEAEVRARVEESNRYRATVQQMKNSLNKCNFDTFNALQQEAEEHGILVCQYDPEEGDRQRQLVEQMQEQEALSAKRQRRVDELEREGDMLRMRVEQLQDEIKDLKKQEADYTQRAVQLSERAGRAYEQLVAMRSAVNMELDKEDEAEEEMIEDAVYHAVEQEEVQSRLAEAVPAVKPDAAPAPVVSDTVLYRADIVSREVAEDTVYRYNHLSEQTCDAHSGSCALRCCGPSGCDLVWSYAKDFCTKADVANVVAGNKNGMELLAQARADVTKRLWT